MDSSPVIEYRNKMLDWPHLLSQNPQQYQACYAPQSGSGLDIDVNSEESNQADQCRYPRPERRYSLCRNRGTVSPKYSRWLMGIQNRERVKASLTNFDSNVKTAKEQSDLLRKMGL